MPPRIFPATSDRWHDLEALFGARGACGGCWCMAWRLPRAQFEKQKGEPNRQSLRALVNQDRAPGVLAYIDDRPAGWCAVAPRHEFVRLQASRIFKPIDDEPVWSITCLFVARPYRKQGLSAALLRGASGYAASCGAAIIEGYPNDLRKEMPPAFVWTGLLPAYLKAGFVEVARRSATRPMVRWFA